MHYDINLNSHYSAPEEVWIMIGEVYKSKTYWTENENDVTDR